MEKKIKHVAAYGRRYRGTMKWRSDLVYHFNLSAPLRSFDILAPYKLAYYYYYYYYYKLRSCNRPLNLLFSRIP